MIGKVGGLMAVAVAFLLAAEAHGADVCVEDKEVGRVLELIRHTEDVIGLSAYPHTLDTLRRLEASFAGSNATVAPINAYRATVSESGRTILEELYAILGPNGSWPDRTTTTEHLTRTISALDAWDQGGRAFLDSFTGESLTDDQRLFMTWVGEELGPVHASGGSASGAKALLMYCRVAR